MRAFGFSLISYSPHYFFASLLFLSTISMVFKSPYPDIEIPDVDVWNLVFNNPVTSWNNKVPDDKGESTPPLTYGTLITTYSCYH
jgi:hypothetical protein